VLVVVLAATSSDRHGIVQRERSYEVQQRARRFGITMVPPHGSGKQRILYLRMT